MFQYFQLSFMELITLSLFVLGLILGKFSLWTWNHSPAAWFCDYDEPVAVHHEGPRLEGRLSAKMIEWSFAFMAILLWGRYGESWVHTAISLITIFLLVQIYLADRKYRIIPDQWILGLGAVAFLSAVSGVSGAGVLNNLMTLFSGLLVTGGIALFVTLCCTKAAGREAVGMGDVKLAAVIGAAAGPAMGISVLAYSSLLCGLVCSVLLAAGKTKKEEAIPFGPFLALVFGFRLLFG